jgi:serine/threonine protein kinase
MQGPPSNTDPSPSRQHRVDALCLRFRQQWGPEDRPLIEDFLAQAPPEERSVVLERLLQLEWALLQGRQETLRLEPYTSRFAEHADVVRSAWTRWMEHSTHQNNSLTAATTLIPPPDPGLGGGVPPELARYKGLQRVGQGGMGVVYRAFDTRLKRFVAVKMIHATAVWAHGIARFRTEAEALARLQHPHIVQVHDWDEYNNQPYLVMEFVAGGSLEDRLRDRPLPALEAARLVAILARAVQHAHTAEVVHRDLKPANVLLAPGLEGDSGTVAGARPKISDFGLARMAMENNAPPPTEEVTTLPPLPEPGSRDSQTITGMQLGTPAYMAPEQAAGKAREVGPPADVWALGVILYRCLSGQLPFQSTNDTPLLRAIQHSDPAPLDDIPQSPGLATLCLRCLNKAPEQRPTARELAEALECLSAAPPSAPAAPSPHRSRRWVWALPIAALVVLATALAAWRFLPVMGDVPPKAGTNQTPIVALAVPQRQEAKPVPSLLRAFRAYHFADRGEAHAPEALGEIGKQAHVAHFGDLVRLEIELTAPAYLYLLAFHPNGKERLLWPFDRTTGEGDEWARGESQQRLEFPPDQRDFVPLDEGAAGGLQAFAVVASRNPLPPFIQWKVRRGRASWGRCPAASGVWGADPSCVFRIRDNGREMLPDGQAPEVSVPLAALVKSLGEGAEGTTVEVRAFGVSRRKEEP